MSSGSSSEYWLDGDWRVVVRYDHDREAAGGHDVTEEGLHRDVYRDGEKYRVEDVSPPVPAGEAFDLAEEDLRDNVEDFIEIARRIPRPLRSERKPTLDDTNNT